MSPRRMDISSLLRDPSPPDDRPRNADRPRSIDALLHPQPASLLSLLNRPFPDSPTRPAPHTPTVPISPPHHPTSAPRPPFLGLDALVHVASEERRRITALSARDAERDPLATHLDRDNPPLRPHLVHDHDWPSRHYPAPVLPHPDFPSPFQDNSRPHKRARDTAPRSPSPDSRLPQLASPNTRLHSSASPTNNYPTLRRPPIEPTPSRSTPALFAATDTRPVSLQHTSPFLHSLHPLQPPSQPSPRNHSPLHHSPQHLRSQHHSPPAHPSSLRSASAELDIMSPRYNHGPRMAGGIQVLSTDPSSVRDAPRPDLSNFQSPGRDLSSERFASESRIEHARHEQPRLSPLSGRVFSLDSNDTQPNVALYQVEGQETLLLRERLRSRPPHLSLHVTPDDDKILPIPAMEADFPAQPPPERHPIRVWEEQPTAHETYRRVSPTRTPSIVAGPVEGRSWSGPTEIGHVERLAMEGRRIELSQDVAENVSTSPLCTSKEPPSHRVPILEPLAADSRAPFEGARVDPQPLQPQLPVQSELRAHLPQTLHPNSSTSRIPASPVLGIHIENLGTNSERQPKPPDTLIDATASTPLASSDQIVTEPLPDQIPGVVKTDDIRMASPQPSRELAQPVVVMEPGSLGVSKYSTHITVSQSTSRSSSQQPLPTLLPAMDEHSVPSEDVDISSPIPPEPPRRSPELENATEQEPSVSDQTMMDVDEELLSLVEDRPVRTGHSSSKMRAKSRSPLPITVGHGTGPSAEQGSNEASGLPSAVSSQPLLKAPLMTDEEKDRASMPPPAARNKKADKDKTALAAGTTTGSKKKKDGTSKPAAKPKQPPKPRAKPTPKPKAKPNVVEPSSKGGISKGTVNVNARSRSTSVIPGATDDIVPEPDVDNSDKEDDKLYCVCKTRYDEDRMMIACDRCDEWFHTLCVNMPDLEIDLVDQFICPPCIQKHPHLRTTWKRRCLFGLRHENPSSPEACHRPSRGAFSKYCSDDCGIKYMQAHIAQWEKSGGARDLLWESVKNAPKREGVVVCVKTNRANSPKLDVDNNNSLPKFLDSAAKRRAEREVTRLNARLEEVVKERELMKRELDMVIWREKVVALATERAGKVDECGWDQRLCFGEEEWADFGPEVLESYEDARVKVESGDDAMPVDAASSMHGEWWCTGKKKCERHAGWQKLRTAEVSFDKETKEGILLKLTTREREIRKCIEDILYPQPSGTLQVPSNPPHPKVQLNGLEKVHSTENVSERAKKKS